MIPNAKNYCRKQKIANGYVCCKRKYHNHNNYRRPKNKITLGPIDFFELGLKVIKRAMFFCHY
jgi:hypothetical protein